MQSFDMLKSAPVSRRLMARTSIPRLALRLKQAVDHCVKDNIDLHAPSKPSLDFKSKQKEACRLQVWSLLAALEKAATDSSDPSAKLLSDRLASVRVSTDLVAVAKAVADVQKLVESMDDAPSEKTASVSLKVSNLPSDIRPAVEADLAELHSCFSAGCYRSAVILCGRILETALHRKYFDATGNDLLEKAPGTGLGNLIAKLAEKDVIIDPALGNQIHLINQVRVHSVHVKQHVFQPSKNQTHAILLYTMDVVEKLFAK